MYDALEWLDYQIAVNKGSAPSTKLYGPSILLDAIGFETVKDIESAFDACSKIYSRHIDYTAIPSDFFSIRDSFHPVIRARLETKNEPVP